jgi:hypothetical protein
MSLVYKFCVDFQRPYPVGRGLLFINSFEKRYSKFRLAKLIFLNKFEANKVNLSITIKISIGFEIISDSN